MEQPVRFAVEGQSLHGILHEPETGASGPVVVFLHGWAGSRIGPHRMFVHMARRLSARGCPCLRFDFRGRGDSDGTPSETTIRSMVTDTRAAIDYVVARYPELPAMLLGICSGGKVAVASAASDTRIRQLALWSAEPMGAMRDGASRQRKTADVLRTYARKLLRPETWRKLITFRVNVRMVSKAVTRQEVAGQDERQDENRWLKEFRAFKGRVLFVYGTNDPETVTAKGGYLQLCREAGMPHLWHNITGANHSFYSLAWEREVMDVTEMWLAAQNGTPASGPGPAGIVTDSAPNCVRT